MRAVNRAYAIVKRQVARISIHCFGKAPEPDSEKGVTGKQVPRLHLLGQPPINVVWIAPIRVRIRSQNTHERDRQDTDQQQRKTCQSP